MTLSKDLWFPFRFSEFLSCLFHDQFEKWSTWPRLSQICVLTPFTPQPAQGLFRRWARELSLSNQWDSQEFCWDAGTETLSSDGCERGGMQHGELLPAILRPGAAGARIRVYATPKQRVLLETKQNWALVTSLGSWICPHWIPQTFLYIYVFPSC